MEAIELEVKRFSRLSRQINKIADSIQSLSSDESRFDILSLSLNEVMTDVLDATKIAKSARKISVDENHSAVLPGIIEDAKILQAQLPAFISTSQRLRNQGLYTSKRKKEALDNYNKLLDTIQSLREYHKFFLNPSFHTHNVDAKQLDNEINPLTRLVTPLHSLTH